MHACCYQKGLSGYLASCFPASLVELSKWVNRQFQTNPIDKTYISDQYQVMLLQYQFQSQIGLLQYQSQSQARSLQYQAIPDEFLQIVTF